jgi:hypothetical protein
LAAGFDFGTALGFATDLLFTCVTRVERAGAAFLGFGLAFAFAPEVFAPAPLLLRGFGFASNVTDFSA